LIDSEYREVPKLSLVAALCNTPTGAGATGLELGRNDVFALCDNPVAGTRKRPEEGARPIETFEPDELRAIAEAARSSLHRTRPAHGYSEEANAWWERINEQDAALFIVAACTELRLGELLALRWSNVDFKAGALIVSRAMSAGEESSTKSRRPRTVPLADQAATELQGLRERPRYTSHTDYVFCRPDGAPLDRSAVRSRFIRAQEQGGRPSAPLPRSATHLRQPGDPTVRPRRRQEHDGSLKAHDDGALSALEAATRRCSEVDPCLPELVSNWP